MSSPSKSKAKQTRRSAGIGNPKVSSVRGAAPFGAEPIEKKSCSKPMETAFMLQLAKGLACEVSRIGYEDEGLRLVFFDDRPYNLHFEVQFSRTDTEKLVTILTAKLKEPMQRNLP